METGGKVRFELTNGFPLLVFKFEAFYRKNKAIDAACFRATYFPIRFGCRLSTTLFSDAETVSEPSVMDHANASDKRLRSQSGNDCHGMAI